jgi:hypothetical protein
MDSRLSCREVSPFRYLKVQESRLTAAVLKQYRPRDLQIAIFEYYRNKIILMMISSDSGVNLSSYVINTF